MKAQLTLLILAAASPVLGAETGVVAASPPVVVAEEEVYQYVSADNGAGPMWCAGSTCLVRTADRLFASGLETLAEARPLNNCRWLLFEREASGWKLRLADPQGRTREPAPLAAFSDGRFFLSANPTLVADPTVYSGPAQPQILEFSADRPEAPSRTLLPEWEDTPAFTEHSYRSLAADGPNRELILFQNIDYTHAEWAFLDREGAWATRGRLAWPWGAEYDKPQPIRVCYPNVALADRAVHFCGVSDIQEPYARWREFKKKLTGRDWDYDFRRLFYTWTPDIRQGGFEPWIEIASRDRTAGGISPYDLWVDPEGRAHILWLERAIDERLRADFFPEARQEHALNYAVVTRGEVTLRRTLISVAEGEPGPIPGAARFHVTPDRALWVFFYAYGQDAAGRAVSENRIARVTAEGALGEALVVPLKAPFTGFFTANPRAGSPLSADIELLGTQAGKSGTISYARIQFSR